MVFRFRSICSSGGAAALPLVLTLGLGQAAFAQGFGMPGAQMSGAAPSFSKEQLDNSLKNNSRPPPAALPGAAAEKAIAPPSNVPTMMSPNDELFDAINRGDITAARDALSRGADLGARDALGMTPLQLSVDLGRNPITFLLLSLRDADPSGSGAATRQAQAGPAQKQGPASKPVLASSGVRRHRVQEATVRPAAGAGGQQTLPKLFADDGGAPIPQAGFLGFGGH